MEIKDYSEDLTESEAEEIIAQANFVRLRLSMLLDETEEGDEEKRSHSYFREVSLAVDGLTVMGCGAFILFAYLIFNLSLLKPNAVLDLYVVTAISLIISSFALLIIRLFRKYQLSEFRKKEAALREAKRFKSVISELLSNIQHNRYKRDSNVL